MSEKKKEKRNVSVDIRKLEGAFAVSLPQFQPGEPYPATMLFDALGLLHESSKRKLRGKME